MAEGGGGMDITAGACSDPVLRLNVGGTIMMARRSTLAMAPPDSVLYRMFANDEEGAYVGNPWSPPVLRDGGVYFLDFNPNHFVVVLDALRHGMRAIPFLTQDVCAGAALVADYLGLVAIAECLNTVMTIPINKRRRVAVVGIDDMWRNGFDLCDMRFGQSVVVGNKWSMKRVRAAAAQACDVPKEHACVYRFASRVNGTVRPDKMVGPESGVSFSRARGGKMRQVRADMALLVLDARDVPYVPEPPPGQTAAEKGRALLFVRRYERSSGTLTECTPALVKVGLSLTTLAPYLTAVVPDRRPFASAHHVVFYEEVHANRVDLLDMDKSIVDQEIEQGDILWIETMPDAPGEETMAMCERDLLSIRTPSHCSGVDRSRPSCTFMQTFFSLFPLPSCSRPSPKKGTTMAIGRPKKILLIALALSWYCDKHERRDRRRARKTRRQTFNFSFHANGSCADSSS
jgi:hypothetical protein